MDWVVDSGLGGRLVTRGVPFGGKGNWPILAVLRIVLGNPLPESPGDGEGTGGSGVVLNVGIEGEELVFVLPGVGSPEEVTDRTEGMAVRLGVVVVRGSEAVDVRRDSGSSPSVSVDFERVLYTGRAGSGFDGGGRAVRGSVEVIVELMLVPVWRSAVLQLSARATGDTRGGCSTSLFVVVRLLS